MALVGLEQFDRGGVLDKDGAKGHRPAFLDQKAGVVTDVEQLVQGFLPGEFDWGAPGGKGRRIPHFVEAAVQVSWVEKLAHTLSCVIVSCFFCM
jgi:hypothetical protein